MHDFVSFNHRISLSSNINISAASNASLYGKGVFTTIAVRDSKLFLWEKHWRRLIRDAKKIGVDLSSVGMHAVKESLAKILEKNDVSEGKCRITFFDESSSKIWQTDSEHATSLLIQTADTQKVKEKFSLSISPFRINSKSPLAGIKSCNYLENILALEDARSKGFDEAVRLNERSAVASACVANIFWRKDGKLFTPSLETGCLAGTMREHIIETEEVAEVEENLETLKNADEIFLTSSGIGIKNAEV